MFARHSMRRSIIVIGRYFSEGTGQSQGSISSAAVPGLSNAVIHNSSQPVGPGVDPSKNGPYKVPEYFLYDNMSYFEAEKEMAKYRLPQPSALKKE
ncbi:uncharacterized protein LOC123714225 [Pieris brassicae]|uniref:NADH dehydrogenase [ubiquinone] flavoprotein 3, mitochondrial n=1 Tax=Pieris brassicae TaxID=7116 RepID=A0A9P0X3P2_PIEBR|nr:uncharacterized protein LOC123714225 [Pieris brassicae]CAH3978546.1 unnamed protein product [Pieris brassicae]